MEVRLEHVFDLCMIPVGPIHIRLYLPQGIEDGGLAFAFDVIGSMRQTTCIDLFDFYDVLFKMIGMC